LANQTQHLRALSRLLGAFLPNKDLGLPKGRSALPMQCTIIALYIERGTFLVH
jgi:hypothetical protein